MASLRHVGIHDLDRALIWISRDTFPGHLDDEMLQYARRTLQDVPEWEAILVDAGASTFYWIDTKTVHEVTLMNDDQVQLKSTDNATGYEMPGNDSGLGVGDGAALAGYPLGWSLISFSCSAGCTILVTRHPLVPPCCPRHGLPMQLVR